MCHYQVRSASFDEMQLESQRNSSQLLKQQSSSSTEERSSDGGYLQVPQAAHAQRSHSFDSAAASVGSDDSGAFLEVPRRLKTRRSSSTKTPPPCIHCFYLEQYERQMSAEQRYFIDHRELSTLSYSYSNTSSEDDSDDEEIAEALANNNDNEEEEDDDVNGNASALMEAIISRVVQQEGDTDADGEASGGDASGGDASGGTEVDDDAAAEMDICMTHRSMGLGMARSIENSRARLPRQMRRHTIGSSFTTSEDEGLDGSDNGSPHFGNTLLPPQPTTPCGITFTLSPTNGPCDHQPSSSYAVPIDPSSPPVTPTTSMFRSSPVLELPPSATRHQQLSATATAAAAALSLPGITSGGGVGGGAGAASCASADADDAGAAMGVPMRPRRRSISRQEAIFVEPTGNSLENVSHEEVDTTKSSVDTADSLDEASIMATCGSPAGGNAAGGHHSGFVVRDIYLTVPDLKRDRAASVDSCFTKLSSGNKTEELQPAEDGCFLTVPNINATRSRSVDIVLPTDEQARYKALAMTGGNGAAGGLYADGYVHLPLTLSLRYAFVLAALNASLRSLVLCFVLCSPRLLMFIATAAPNVLRAPQFILFI